MKNLSVLMVLVLAVFLSGCVKKITLDDPREFVSVNSQEILLGSNVIIERPVSALIKGLWDNSSCSVALRYNLIPNSNIEFKLGALSSKALTILKKNESNLKFKKNGEFIDICLNKKSVSNEYEISFLGFKLSFSANKLKNLGTRLQNIVLYKTKSNVSNKTPDKSDLDSSIISIPKDMKVYTASKEELKNDIKDDISDSNDFENEDFADDLSNDDNNTNDTKDYDINESKSVAKIKKESFNNDDNKSCLNEKKVKAIAKKGKKLFANLKISKKKKPEKVISDSNASINTKCVCKEQSYFSSLDKYAMDIPIKTTKNDVNVTQKEEENLTSLEPDIMRILKKPTISKKNIVKVFEFKNSKGLVRYSTKPLESKEWKRVCVAFKAINHSQKDLKEVKECKSFRGLFVYSWSDSYLNAFCGKDSKKTTVFWVFAPYTKDTIAVSMLYHIKKGLRFIQQKKEIEKLKKDGFEISLREVWASPK